MNISKRGLAGQRDRPTPPGLQVQSGSNPQRKGFALDFSFSEAHNHFLPGSFTPHPLCLVVMVSADHSLMRDVAIPVPAV